MKRTRRTIWGSTLFLAACASQSPAGPTKETPDAGASRPTAPPSHADAAAPVEDASGHAPPFELHFAFVHGVGDSGSYAHQDDDLVDVEKSVVELVELNRNAFETARHVSLVVSSTRVNLYTDLAGNVLSPGIDEGDQLTVATNWRRQLSLKLAAAFPNGEKNIVLVGHSTGARVSMELTADVDGADNTIGAGNWGFADRVAGVVSLHGMIDALGHYETVGVVVSFETGCKFDKPAGWCAYAANVSARPAADWVAANRRSLVLTSVVGDNRCGTALFTEGSDHTLPTRAQGNPAAAGIGTSPDNDGVYHPTHGFPYGEFCHSDITSTSSPRHQDAVDQATTRIAAWLFDAAPRVVNPTEDAQTYATPVVSNLATSDPLTITLTCPEGTKSAKAIDVVGNCSHPGHTDGDDHAMTLEQLISTSDGSCGGSIQWKNIHNHPHPGTMWFKSYAQEAGGLLGTLK